MKYFVRKKYTKSKCIFETFIFKTCMFKKFESEKNQVVFNNKINVYIEKRYA